MSRTVEIGGHAITASALVEDAERSGETLVLERNGRPVAHLIPHRAAKIRTFGQLIEELLPSLPPVDDDFLEDLRQIRREQDDVPGSKWES